ncbi:MAG: hypothetical protein HUU34_03975 [Saprospiraceae bacterium]|nr:hypothetical protein [Saprospiraceae bacterium]
MEERKVDCDSMKIGGIEVPNPPITKSINHEGMEKELAFHEAGHFVFSCMMTKYLPVFTPIDYAITCSEITDLNNDERNVVHGNAPIGLTDDDLKNPGKLRKFYIDDNKRIIVKVFTSFAGVATYPEFIESVDRFVGIPNGNGDALTYYDFKTAYSLRFADFNNIKRWIKYINIPSYKETIFVCKLLEGTRRMMKIQAVRDSIIYIHRRLLKNKCNRVEGIELAKLIVEVQRLTNKVPYMAIVKEYEQIIEDFEKEHEKYVRGINAVP